MTIDKRITDALTSMIYVSRLNLAGETVTEDDQKLRASGLYYDFSDTKAYSVGDVFNTHQTEGLSEEWEQTWECHQAIDPAKNPGVVPGVSAWFTFFKPLHGKTPETARPWVRPQYGTTDIYKYREYMIWSDGLIYECVAENGTNYSPDEFPGGWVAHGPAA